MDCPQKHRDGLGVKTHQRETKVLIALRTVFALAAATATRAHFALANIHATTSTSGNDQL